MRVIWSFLLVILIRSSIQAQTVPDHKTWIGLAVRPGYSPNIGLSVVPRVGYWINQHFLTGLEGRFGVGYTSTSVRSWGVGAFGRYYAGQGPVVFLSHVGLDYEHFSVQNTSSVGTIVARPAIGVHFGRLSKPLGVELLVDKPISFSKQAADIGNLKSQFGIYLGVQLSF